MSGDSVGIVSRTEFRCAARFNGESVMPPAHLDLPSDPEEVKRCALSLHQRLCDLQNFLINPNCVVLLIGADGKEPSRWERVAYHVE